MSFFCIQNPDREIPWCLEINYVKTVQDLYPLPSGDYDSEKIISKVLIKADFWQTHRDVVINDRQRKAINKLLDAGQRNFIGGLTTRKYVSMTKVSRATAYREINDLVGKGLLVQNEGGGRSVSYDIAWPK